MFWAVLGGFARGTCVEPGGVLEVVCVFPTLVRAITQQKLEFNCHLPGPAKIEKIAIERTWLMCGVARTAAACASLLLFWTAIFFIKMISY